MLLEQNTQIVEGAETESAASFFSNHSHEINLKQDP